jgi:flagellar hook-associated protein 3 FlgL
MKDIMSTQTNLVKLQSQITSGKQATTFFELQASRQIDNVMSIESQMGNINDSLISNSLIVDRLSMMDQAFSELIELMTLTKSQLITRRSSIGSVMNFSQIAKSSLSAVKYILNTEFEGRYLFSGSRTTTMPVGDIENITNVINQAPTANYYNGDDTVLSANITSTININYGIKANDPAFQNLIACLNTVLVGEKTGDDAEFGTALEYLDKAYDQVIELRSQNGNFASTVLNVNNQYTNTLLYTKQTLARLTDTDLPSATASLYSQDAILRASYATLSRLTSTSLNDYL